jgi:hypothetical protein
MHHASSDEAAVAGEDVTLVEGGLAVRSGTRPTAVAMTLPAGTSLSGQPSKSNSAKRSVDLALPDARKETP